MIRKKFIKKNDSNLKNLTGEDLTKHDIRQLNKGFETRVKLKKYKKSSFHKDYYIA